MTEILTPEDLEKAAPRVLSRLRAMADLPHYGTVAGQSVASLFWEELGLPVRGPINDIDVFVNSNLPRSMRGLEEFTQEQRDEHLKQYYAGVVKRRVNRTSVNMREVGLETSNYEHVKFIALRATTTILRTYQAGLVNYTLINSPLLRKDQLGHCIQVSRELIDGFDLNIVGVGINLESEQVVATQGFIDFLNCHKIRVETCNTPAHTMIRLAHKCFSGQIQNATCDFPQERAMLELAVACNVTPHGNSSSAHSVLDFGGGKYKALYDRYEEMLPSITSSDRRVREGECYTLYSMQPITPVIQCDVDLHARTRGLDIYPPCVFQHIYVSDFPQVYELFHPERSLLSLDEIDHRRAEFEKINKEASDGHNIRCMQAAMGKPTVNLEVEGLNDDESVVFFFNQECAKDPARAQAAALAMCNLPAFERYVVIREGYRADTVLLLSKDRTNTWKNLLRERSPHLISVVSSYVSNSKQGTGRHAPMYEILGWMKEMGADGTAIAHRILPVHRTGGEHDAHLRVFLSGFPVDQQPKVAHQMMEWVLPSWPCLEKEPTEVRCRALAIWVGAGQSVPAAFWEHAQQEDYPTYFMTACDTLRNRIADPHFEVIRDEILNAILPRLSDEQIAVQETLLLRACLLVEGHETLQSILSKKPVSRLLDKSLSSVLNNLKEARGFNNNLPKSGFSLSLETWGRKPTDRDRVTIDSILLTRATLAIEPPSSPRRLPRL